ncbi:MAG: ribosome assembly factor SBDS [Methanomassiliicoccales archaeon]|nr:MAG: ribosome assembly factor SBDS [Methanomassiliicoccales archaeon]
MVKLEDAVIARLEIESETFEILIDPESAQKFKNGEDIGILESLVIDTIFKDSKKGDKASEEKMNKIFSTNDISEVAKRILLEGTIQLTTEQRKQMQENKRKQIVASIVRNAINPQTGAPHPSQRIELAMKEAKVQIDPFKPVDLQVQYVLDKLRAIIPIRFEKVKIAVKLSGENYGRTYGDITSFGKIIREEWQSNGSWIGVVEIPAGLQSEFFDKLNKKTKGEVETKILK